MALSSRSLITKTGISTTQVFDMGGINISGGDFNLGSAIKLGNASGIITATTFSGSFTGTISAGESTFSGNILPNTDSSHNIGSNGVRFANIYGDALYGVIQNTTHTNITRVGTLSQLAVSGSANPLNITHTSANCVNLNRGGKSIAIDVNYGGSNTHSLINLSSGMDLRFKLGGTDKIVFKSAGHIEPQTDSQINLGSNSVRFANLYADTLYGDGSNLTGITQTTINNNATTKFITGTNNANELDCEANLSYNNSLVTFASSSLMVSKSTSPTISVKETAGNKEGAFRANTDGVLLRTLGNYPLIFHTNQTERAQIDGSGRFLIGTNSVYNANSYSNNLIIYENGDAGASIIGNASNSNYASLYLTDTSTAIKGYLEAQLGVNGNFTIGANGTGPIRFTNNGAERLRIRGDGKVIIGTGNRNQETSTGAVLIDRDITAESDQGDPNNYHLVLRSQTNSNTSKLGIGFVNTSDDTSIGAAILHHRTGGGSVGDLAFYTSPSDGTINERFRIDKDGKFYKAGNHFYPLVNYSKYDTFTAVSTSSSSYTDLRTILSSYTPKKAGNLIVIHHQSQLWQGGDANGSGDAMWKIQKQEGGGSWTDVISNERIIGNMDGRNYTGDSGLARHHRTVHLMGSFECAGTTINLKTQGKVDFTSVGLQWYHHNENILQVWEYEKG